MGIHQMRTWVESNSGKTYKNFINGEWQESVTGRTAPLYESVHPDKLLGHFPSSESEDVERAVQAAEKAFHKWKKTSAAERANILYRFADLLIENQAQLSYILSAEQGKLLSESSGEVSRAAAEARVAAGEALKTAGDIFPSENPQIETKVIREPVGVIAAISPWNFPIVTPVRKIAPAIAYGCTVVLKPASLTPWSSIKIMELLKEAGLPHGVVNVVIGSGSKVGDALVSHPLVKGVSFTGSTSLGLRINGLAASKLTKTQLELGGKNAAIIIDYENLQDASEQIVSAAFACTGQRCTAISRVIVLENQADELLSLLEEKVSNLRVGPAWEENVNMGPLINKQQFDSVMEYVNIGKEEGARLVLGGDRINKEGTEDGHYLAPALFTDVEKHMKIAKEEIFGPVLVVLKAQSISEAVSIANSTEYGLAASVFTNRLEVAQEFSSSLETGMIHINHGTASQAHVPFGGVKKSGFGAFSIGPSNKEFFTVMKAIYTKKN